MSTFYPNNRPPLRPNALIPLPLGAVRPLGWLRDQLRIQADGLTGHLEEFWPDLGPDNMWLGGKTEGWERGPYYLDGLVPLAYTLDDARLKSMAQRWVDSVLSMQDAAGWIGPTQAPGRAAYDQWPVVIVLKALTQYQEATGDPRVVPALTGFCRSLRDTLDENPLRDWGEFRWADLVLSIHWLYNRTGEAWLLDVASKVHAQGYDWRRHFAEFPFTGKTARFDWPAMLATHGVNSAMAVKAGGVWGRQSGEPADIETVYRALAMLDRYHGQATGIFTCDEHYAGLDPSQGTELCTVVESMFSLEELCAILGDPALADRLERIAYNALPAALTPDMWAHQYDQQANQVLCTVAPRRWTNNDDTSNIYGLEPNFGCCTANLHQGWPKLVRSLWMATGDGGLAAVAYGPSAVTARVGDGAAVTLRAETDYPFRGEVHLAVQAERPVRFPLRLRVPAWASGATVRVGEGALQAASAGTFHTVEREWQDGDRVTLTLPMVVCLERRYRNAVTVVRGPLVFALKIGEEFRQIGGERPHADWEVRPTGAWNYGLALGGRPPAEVISVRESPVGSVPFAPNAAPVTLSAPARRVPSWTLEENSAGPLPPSPVAVDTPPETVELIPYGSTHLRITEFPEVTV